MGIVKGLLKFVETNVTVAALDVAIKGLDKAAVVAKKRDEKSVQKFLETNPDHCHLFAAQILNKLKETYYIYDCDRNVRYVIKGELLSMKHHLHVYDATGRSELATVKEQLISLRSPFSFDTNPKDFVIAIGGKKIGKVRTKAAFFKHKFDITFNEWTVEGDIIGKNYKVVDKNKNIVMTISQKWSIGYDLYWVDIVNPENELYCVLILLALDAASTTKSEDKKRAIKKKMIL